MTRMQPVTNKMIFEPMTTDVLLCKRTRISEEDQFSAEFEKMIRYESVKRQRLDEIMKIEEDEKMNGENNEEASGNADEADNN